jgi:hypothetical protein
LAFGTQQRLHQPPSHGPPRRLHQALQALVSPRSFEQGFQNGAQVPNRNPLPQQLLQDPSDFAQGQEFGNQLFEQLGVGIIE